MVNCFISMCKSRIERMEPGITFHRFPLKNPDKIELWMQSMVINCLPNYNNRICSKHFESRMFYKIGNKTFLTDEAIPTIVQELRRCSEELPGVEVITTTERSSNSETPLISSTSSGTPSTSSGTPSTSSGTPSTSSETPRQVKLRRTLFKQIQKNRAKSRKIKALGQKLKRCKKKLSHLRDVIGELKTNNLLSEENALILEGMPGVIKELMTRKLAKKCKYSPGIRKFAVTLSFYSPKGYDYVRNTFETCLPHRSTIGKW